MLNLRFESPENIKNVDAQGAMGMHIYSWAERSGDFLGTNRTWLIHEAIRRKSMKSMR